MGAVAKEVALGAQRLDLDVRAARVVFEPRQRPLVVDAREDAVSREARRLRQLVALRGLISPPSPIARRFTWTGVKPSTNAPLSPPIWHSWQRCRAGTS